MIWLIAKKDFLLNLLSVRFIIGFVLCLLVIPFTIIVSVDNYENQVRVYKIEQAQADKELKECRVWSAVRPAVIQEPEPLSIFSTGIISNIGNKVKIAFWEYPLFPEGHTITRDNPLLNAFFSIDFSKVIAILISLLALVFSYDAITREREDGTMKLTFTGQVSRISFLMGKLLGLLLTLLPILLFCYLLACLIIVVNPGISFSASDWGGLLLLFLTSVIYMLVFLLLGMFISSRVTHSSSSIIISLLCWIWFLFLMPNIATYLAQSISKAPLYDNVQAAMEDYDDTYYKEYMEEWPRAAQRVNMKFLSYNNCNGDNVEYLELAGGPKETPLFHQQMQIWATPVMLNNADKKWALQRDYLDGLMRQQHLQQTIAWLSPSELFGQATEALCHTNANSFLKYMDGLRNYRESVITYFKDNKLFESTAYFTPQPLDEFPTQAEVDSNDGTVNKRYDRGYSEFPYLDISGVPRYIPQSATISVALGDALGRLCALLGLAIVLLVGTIVSFMKYDVR
ncbi:MULTISPECIES: ABC transporter permease subunit [Parabacteroides]|uniref:ABC transporter permease subunit n=1 Tax=Parabacteroides leei TaxID=2939491 RepID=UPI00189B15B4|nr:MULTISPECIES: ABC transporter permease subunit [Parabacteroides]MCL3850172.1 ABC transporter permease subunit [Parabacteroides leei]